MRGRKVITFVEFAKICNRQEFSRPSKCSDNGNFAYGCDCCASFCSRWRKLGRADTKEAAGKTVRSAVQQPHGKKSRAKEFDFDVGWRGM